MLKTDFSQVGTKTTKIVQIEEDLKIEILKVSEQVPNGAISHQQKIQCFQS